MPATLTWLSQDMRKLEGESQSGPWEVLSDGSRNRAGDTEPSAALSLILHVLRTVSLFWVPATVLSISHVTFKLATHPMHLLLLLSWFRSFCPAWGQWVLEPGRWSPDLCSVLGLNPP